MKKITKFLATILFLTASLSVYAIDLDTAKADGLVGERADGYLGAVRDNVSAEVSALVNDINGKRKAQYQRIAVKNEIPLADVEVLAGKKTIEKTEPGGWVFIDSWVQK